MTNYEWITQLPPEELVKYLTCDCCSKEGYDEEFNNCFGESCQTYQVRWLLQKRKEK